MQIGLFNFAWNLMEPPARKQRINVIIKGEMRDFIWYLFGFAFFFFAGLTVIVSFALLWIWENENKQYQVQRKLIFETYFLLWKKISMVDSKNSTLAMHSIALFPTGNSHATLREGIQSRFEQPKQPFLQFPSQLSTHTHTHNIKPSR